MIKVIQKIDELWIVKALVAEPLADVGIIFLFDVSVVIFFVGTGASELDGRLSTGISEVTQEVIVEEFTTIVAIKTFERKRQRLFDVLNLQKDVSFAFAPDGALFGPTGSNVDEV